MAAFFLHAWAKRHHATGFDELIGCQLSRVTDGVRTTRGLRTEDAWFDALEGVFGLRFPGWTVARRAELWERVRHNWRTRDVLRDLTVGI